MQMLGLTSQTHEEGRSPRKSEHSGDKPALSRGSIASGKAEEQRPPAPEHVLRASAVHGASLPRPPSYLHALISRQ